jgi:hypothetical protein
MGYSYLNNDDKHSMSHQGSHGNNYIVGITVDGGKEIIGGKDKDLN